MNFREIKLVEGNKYTVVFYDGLIGITTAKVTLVDYYVDKYAQFENSLFLEVKVGRQRFIREFTFAPNEPVLIIEGWEKVGFDELYTETISNGIKHRASNVLSQSKKWIECAYNQHKSKTLLYNV